MKTAEKFPPFDKHEKMARQRKTWRMRGVVCTDLAAMHRYIEFSNDASPDPGLPKFTQQEMETIRDKIRAVEIPKTAESHAKHVDFVQSAKEARLSAGNARRSRNGRRRPRAPSSESPCE